MAMSESEKTPEEGDRKALEALVVHNPEFERLEVLLDEFNIALIGEIGEKQVL